MVGGFVKQVFKKQGPNDSRLGLTATTLAVDIIAYITIRGEHLSYVTFLYIWFKNVNIIWKPYYCEVFNVTLPLKFTIQHLQNKLNAFFSPFYGRKCGPLTLSVYERTRSIEESLCTKRWFWGRIHEICSGKIKWILRDAYDCFHISNDRFPGSCFWESTERNNR